MRTAFWSLAALAGVAFGTPDGWGSGWGSAASSSASPATTPVVVSSSSASSSSSAASSSSSVPAAVSSSKVSSKVSTSEASTSSESSSVSKEHSTHYSTVTVPETITVHTTVYTTVGTETVTKTSGGKTFTTTIVSTHTGTSTITSTIKATKSASKPVSSPSKHHSHSKPLSSPVGPVSTSELHTGVVTTPKSSDVTVWKTHKSTTTVCPVVPTCAVSAADVSTTVTDVAYTYTTVCPVTATRTDGSSTYTKTFDVTSTITTTTAATVTLLHSGGHSTVIVTPVPASASASVSASKHGHGHGHHSKHSSKLSSLISAASSASHESVSKASKIHSEHKSKSTAASSAKVSVAAVSSSSKIAVTTISSSSSAKATITSSTSSSSASPAWPTRAVGPNPYGDDCVPCKGQPGSDPETFCGMTVETDSYDPANIPITCKHKTYDFTLSNTTISPDGYARYGLVINGQFPGPLVEANWGDWITITLHNELANNGTSLHMHGLRQYYTNEMDGVASITQCPVAPGETFTYTFRADNYGTSWYHSHFSLQTYEGFFGPVTIHGPVQDTVEYVSEENIVLSDWNHIPVDEMFDAAQWNGPAPPVSGPRTLDTGLINGQNVYYNDKTGATTGNYFELKVEAGKKYRLRLVSASIQGMWKFSVDSHILTVIAADFVPIVPYTTEYLNVNIGQRYDVILFANQAPDNYWMRSTNQEACNLITNGNVTGIVRYSDSTALPTSTGYDAPNICEDEPYASLVPVLQLNAGAATKGIQREQIRINVTDQFETQNIYRWTLGNAFFQAQYEHPTLNGIVDSNYVNQTDNIVIDASIGDWVYLVIDTTMGDFGPPPNIPKALLPPDAPPTQTITHPIHLHGHDFFVLAQGTGPWTEQTALNLVNPPRRDVAMMPGDNSGGHIVIAWKADNPGAWLLHCHIGWHNAMGFALQIVEGQDSISSTIADKSQVDGTCAAWNKYKNADMVLDAGV